MPDSAPHLVISINYWSLWDKRNPDGSPWSIEQMIAAVAEAGFDAFTCPPDTPDLKALLDAHGLRYGGAFQGRKVEEFAPAIAAALSIGDGPINCQLGNHDTLPDEALSLALALLEEADRQGADVHIELHRNTATETPEKGYALFERIRETRGCDPRVNFDFSHPACFKHLEANEYIDRLIENVPLFQNATLWHMRPFNGHHCQVPVTDGRGNFSPEYEDIRPFTRQAITLWLQGPRPKNELWIMPELGPTGGYGLSCFPDVWEDTIFLGRDIRQIWGDCLQD